MNIYFTCIIIITYLKQVLYNSLKKSGDGDQEESPEFSHTRILGCEVGETPNFKEGES